MYFDVINFHYKQILGFIFETIDVGLHAVSRKEPMGQDFERPHSDEKMNKGA